MRWHPVIGALVAACGPAAMPSWTPPPPEQARPAVTTAPAASVSPGPVDPTTYVGPWRLEVQVTAVPRGPDPPCAPKSLAGATLSLDCAEDAGAPVRASTSADGSAVLSGRGPFPRACAVHVTSEGYLPGVLFLRDCAAQLQGGVLVAKPFEQPELHPPGVRLHPAGAQCSNACPLALPARGSACPQQRGVTQCVYYDDAAPGCVTRALCDHLGWAILRSEACPNAPECPHDRPRTGEACASPHNDEIQCGYPDAKLGCPWIARCGTFGPGAYATSPPTMSWLVKLRADCACPRDAPADGASCPSPAQCLFGSRYVECTGGRWQTKQPPPPPGPPPGPPR